MAIPSFNQKELQNFLAYRKDGSFRRKVRAGNSDPKGQIVRGTLRPDGYRKLQINKQQFLFHRIVFFWHWGWMPEYVDHFDRDKNNNRIENLRSVTASQNSRNCGLNSRNKSGVRGVIWRKEAKHWVSFICYKKKYMHLYQGPSKNQAIKIRAKAEKILHGEFAKS